MEKYELSLWRIVLQNTASPFSEEKIGIIGSNTLIDPCHAFNIKLNMKINGEKTLNFSIAYNYSDPISNTIMQNPWISYMIPEQIVKCYWRNDWYEFIIKDVNVDSSKKIYNITCKDRFVQELSRSGYHIILDNELQNGSGTIDELISVVLKGTDWQYDEANSDLIQQDVREAVYETTLNNNINELLYEERTNSQNQSLSSGDIIYLFYSQLYDIGLKCGYYKTNIVQEYTNTGTTRIQFLVCNNGYQDLSKNEWVDGNIYHFQDNITPSIIIPIDWEVNNNIITFQYNNTTYFTFDLDSLATPTFFARRLVQGQKSHYEPVLGRYVNEYTDGQPISGYQTTLYNDVTIIQDYIVNGNTFSNLQGWSGGLTSTKLIFEDPNFTNYLRLKGRNGAGGTEDSGINTINNKLVYQIPSATAINTVVNSGLSNNLTLLEDGLQPGKEFWMRAQCGYGNDSYTAWSHFSPTGKLEAPFTPRITTYLQSQQSGTNTYIYPYNTKYTYSMLKGASSTQLRNNFGIEENSKYYYIKNGIIKGNRFGTTDSFEISDISTDSTQIYVDTGFLKDDYCEVYTWNNGWARTDIITSGSKNYQSVVVPKYSNNSDIYEWYFKCNKSFTKAQRAKEKIGIILWCPANRNSGELYLMIPKIEFFDYTTIDGVNPVYPYDFSNTNTIVQPVYKYYYTNDAKNLTDPADLKYIKISLDPEPENVFKPQYYTNFEKVCNVNIKQSNRFNILQTLAESFQCWVQLYIPHTISGFLVYNYETNQPEKYIRVKKVIGEDNGLAFTYSIDLKSIQRTTNSDSITTKTIVIPYVNDLGINGMCTIANSALNYSRESYILDFTYFIRQGLLDKTNVNNDLYGEDPNIYIYDDLFFGTTNLAYLSRLNKLNIRYDELSNQIIENNTFLTRHESLLAVQQKAYDATIEEINTSSDFLMQATNKSTLSEAISTAIASSTDTLRARAITIQQAQQDLIKYLDNISNIQEQVDILNAKIAPMVEEQEKILVKENALNEAFYYKYAPFLKEGTWSSTKYIDNNEYYMAAVDVAYTSALPRVTYNISVVRVETISDYNGRIFHLGDICYIQDPDLFGYIWTKGIKTPYKEKVIISECTYNFDDPSKDSFKVQNYHTQFEDLFHRIAASVQALQYKEGEYAPTRTYTDINGVSKKSFIRHY